MAQENATKITNEIWEQIKNKKLELFALPPQSVEKFFTPIMVDNKTVHLIYNISAALPALEVALGKEFLVELAGKYVVVSRA